jgi:hypothetical protein
VWKPFVAAGEMTKLRPQQIARDFLPVPSGKEKRAAKRAGTRKMRREAKRDAENASKKHQYFGWFW